jgi:hypothetical protein
VTSGHAVLGDVGARRFAASIWGGTLFHLGPVPRATPGGHYLGTRASEPREHLSAAVLFELITERSLLVAPELHDVREVAQGTHGGVLDDVSGGEVTSERWRSDGWVLRSSRCVQPASHGRSLVQLALQHEDGEPISAFVTLREPPSGSGEQGSVAVYLHGLPAVVEPVVDRVRAWLVARGWSVDADRVR